MSANPPTPTDMAGLIAQVKALTDEIKTEREAARLARAAEADKMDFWITMVNDQAVVNVDQDTFTRPQRPQAYWVNNTKRTLRMTEFALYDIYPDNDPSYACFDIAVDNTSIFERDLQDKLFFVKKGSIEQHRDPNVAISTDDYFSVYSPAFFSQNNRGGADTTQVNAKVDAGQKINLLLWFNPMAYLSTLPTTSTGRTIDIAAKIHLREV